MNEDQKFVIYTAAITIIALLCIAFYYVIEHNILFAFVAHLVFYVVAVLYMV